MDINLLVIDDDPVHIKLVDFIISQSGAPVKTCAFVDASDAFVFILKHNSYNTLPDLVLLDLDMPLVSGWGFLELFETIAKNLDKPVDVIIFTSLVNAEIKDRAAKYNCVKGVFSKPFTEYTLTEILNSGFISANKPSKY
jgi:CheY-like chemotaxis protein